MNFKENLIKELEDNDVFLSLSHFQRLTIAEIAEKQLLIHDVSKSFVCGICEDKGKYVVTYPDRYGWQKCTCKTN